MLLPEFAPRSLDHAKGTPAIPSLVARCVPCFILYLVLWYGEKNKCEQIIDKRAALIILKRLIQDMMEAGQEATEARRVGEREGERHAWERQRRRRDQANGSSVPNGGVFFLDRGSSGDPDASVDGDCREGTSEGGGQLGVDAQHKDDDGITGVGPDDELISSPRKRQRLRNLRLAKGMERARENDIAVVGRWIPSVP